MKFNGMKEKNQYRPRIVGIAAIAVPNLVAIKTIYVGVRDTHIPTFMRLHDTTCHTLDRDSIYFKSGISN